MKNTYSLLCLLLFSLLVMFHPAQAATEIINLQVEYQTNPLGIDVAKPRFNWQMVSERYGAAQTAYQLWVAESAEALASGSYTYDSGKISSDASVSILYEGDILQACSRYYWKVRVWDESGNALNSMETAWFETGLLGSGWSHAQWIGSSKVQLPKYRSHYVIDFDMQISEGSNRAVFVFGARDDKNFVSAEINLNGKGDTQFILSHTTDGKEVQDAIENISDIIPAADKHKKHHLKIDVTTAQYALKYFANISINGKELTDTSLSSEELKRKQTPGWWGDTEGMFTVYPYPNGDLVYHCRLYAIGFKQPKGEKANFSGITISEKVWNTTLYHSSETYTENGSGKLNVWLPGEDVSAPMLRKSIQIDKPIKKARLYATARGIYEFSINGKKLGNDYFNPGWTDYRFRFMYNTYDITSLFKSGDNGIGAMLGTGWWSEHSGFMTTWQDQYGTRQSLLAKITIEYTDGSTQTIVTDKSWKCFDNGPILLNSLQNGEEYDARKEVKGWTDPNFNDSSWENALVYQQPPANVKIQAYVGNPVQNNITLTAQSVVEALPGVYVYDMGQNMVGVPRLSMKGKNGQEIMIRFGEMNYPDIIPTDPVAPYTIEMYKQKKGQVYTDNYRSALSVDRYIMKGDPSGETYEPRFTFHGYRYVEIHGLDKPLPLEDVKGIVLESIGAQTSSYKTSNEQVNRLYENILWGQRGNFLAVPTDCPQRDERMGWTGDAQVFARTATYNMNVNPFYTRWLYSVRDNQGEDGRYANYIPVVGTPPHGADIGGGAMGWMEAGIIVPWQMYQQYNDIGILEQHYASMVAYMDYLERTAVNYVQPFGGFGDWLAIEGTNSMLTNTAYSAYDALLMEQIAKRLGKEADSKRFRAFYENVKESFNKYFVDNEGYTYAPAPNEIFGQGQGDMWSGPSGNEGKRVDTQTSYVVPLQFGLFNDKNKPLALKHLTENIKKHNYTLTTGFIGTPYLNLVLSDNGYDDIAYKLFEQTAYPSWLYPVLQGATTIWERWNSYTLVNGFGPVDMNSFNHYSYGAIEEWMIAYSIGIQRDEQNPGYKHILLQPRIGGNFSFIKGHYDSVYGRIESGWQKSRKGYIYNASVPANTKATLTLQVKNPSNVKQIKGREGIRFISFSNGKATYELQAGSYQFSIE
ncbi:alpha-L-rhamnosidase [Parabacteroides sp. PF5-5]|uniref:alpha-L-rhamnosidase n=1 Tax=unclassified Parabacteroides TaxID=2649774 RepID=UPI0024765114|nr:MULTISPECIES: alpha-L-rhamnosidase [unclassified Parabacteroides]MDH6305286.1 alpha-L-rhamnosidase [Parabacteroides sp. PH5-39]MDH6316639.1 alpha-L-rhamnosidase [Parabacteroides sp. PF5-13]MDH6320181.1 alpha-L-rhamnosidase [Parabacteroides sp. PH5-13]MDH6323876.1 alpha-L-rhamnosidase [Parabacteroides sp. PH5-8]MDH6327858.1 alpha-L-rhamnosidase [Parabacteroides sp. PH5-41]